MSGICGIVRLDGGQVDPADLAGMTDQLERRGPDGTHQSFDGSVALGHTLLATTPEALVEGLPLTDPESRCRITADVRLDNRDELIPELGLDGVDRIIGDGELILRAYLQWGEDCLNHLLGDFAFAIWDPRSQQLFCVRDHMGMRQLIYHHDAGRHFVFATEAEAVLAHPKVPRRINDARIADFLDDLEGIDLTSTFFEQVYRLPPAHCLTVSNVGLSLKRYWKLRPGPMLELPSDQAYGEAFLNVFNEAVRCRLRSAGPVGSMLSGGMDSGSVTAVAARLLSAEGRGPLSSFSAVGPDPQSCIETRCIHASASTPDIRAKFVSHGQLDEFADDLLRLSQLVEPFDWHMTLIRAVYLAGHRAGVNVMVDGVGGDTVTSAGNRIALFVRRGQPIRAAKEARAEARYYGPPLKAWKLYLAACWAALAPNWMRRLRRRILLNRPIRGQLQSSRRLRTAGLARSRGPMLEDVGTPRPFEAAHRARLAVHPYIVVARERYDRVAAALAIEPRDPFMDIRLISFILSLPVEQLQGEGWPKLIIRRAMAGILPETVLWRSGKEHLGMDFTLALAKLSEASLLLRRPQLEELLHADALAALDKSPLTKMDRERKFKLTSLANWLARNQPVAESFER